MKCIKNLQFEGYEKFKMYAKKLVLRRLMGKNRFE